MIDKTKVKSSDDINKSVVIGTFEGECADSTITNLNGLDITREVWEKVFESEDYKKAIDLGWYIGYLGHPEDPNCMDFQQACIVMTEGHIDSTGKIFGKFNLVDTPVGRIVKSFIDAGVTFGISVRGAGDIYDNSVDPDTFVFRGFDLVSFPAYPDSIPKFTEIAASSDIEKQKKYKSICAAVKQNLEDIKDCDTLDIIQSHFAKQSAEYQMIDDRKQEILGDGEEFEEICQDEDISEDKIQALTEMYAESIKANKELQKQNKLLSKKYDRSITSSKRKIESIQRIMSAQIADVDIELSSANIRCASAIEANKELESKLKDLKKSNLKYRQKVESATQDISEKDTIISSLRSELSETVNAASDAKSRTSNLDAKISRLQKELSSTKKLLADYQLAYANIYGNAIGNYIDTANITASTTVEDIQKMVTSSVSFNRNHYTDFNSSYAQEVFEDDSDDTLVTL